MKKHSFSQSGQALILIVFGIIGLIGMTALAIDGGNAYSDHRHAQNAADTAALAAALAKVRNQDWGSAGLSRASTNGYNNNGTTNTVNVYNPPISGTYSGNSDYVQVIIVSHISTYFAQVIGIPQITNTVNAVAHATPPTQSPMFPGQAIVGLDPNGCKAVTYQGSANTVIQDPIAGNGTPGLFVNSDCSNSAFFNNSNGATLTAGSLCSVGGITYNPGALNIPTSNIVTGCPSVPYPDPTYQMPNPDCSGTAQVSGTTMSAGNWSGSFPPNNVTTLQPGIYCINGNFKLNGNQNLSGDGVLFYMESGSVDWAGSSTFNFSAFTSGPYAHLLIYLPYSNSSSVTINGNSNSTYNGTILAPASNVTINGSSTNTVSGQVIGYDVTLSGSGNTTINYDAGSNYDAVVQPNLQLAQ